MLIVRQLTLSELIYTAIIMLIGEEGKDFAYYENDPAWWGCRLLMRIN